MNSADLKKKYHDTYNAFFALHETILSVPLTMPLWHDSEKYHTGLRIIQKIPLRMYIGATPISQSEEYFGDVTYLDYCTHTYKTIPALQYKSNLIDLVPDSEERNTSKIKYKYSFLIEIQKNIGIGVYKYMMLLLGCMKIHQDPTKPTIDAQAMQTDSPFMSELQQQRDEWSQKTPYGLDRLFDLIVCQDSFYPALGLSNLPGQQRMLNDFRPGLRDQPSRVLDQTLIYSGLPDRYYRHDEERKLSPMFQEQCDSLFKKSGDKAPELYKRMQSSLSQRKDIIPFAQNLASRFLDSIGLLNHVDFEKSETINHVTLIKTKQLLEQMSHMQHDDLYLFIDNLRNTIGKPFHEMARYELRPYKHGGSIVLMSPMEQYRRHIQAYQDSIEQDSLDNSCVVYKSREDGEETRGLVVEQDTNRGVFSSYIQKGYVKLTQSGKNVQMGERSLSGQKKFPILINRKILIYGNKVTSKDIPSQSYTIEVLDILIKNRGMRIENSDLPIGSYSKNKNEFISKIVGPFKKIATKIFSVDFPIECSGAGNRFWVQLKYDPIGITVAEEITNKRE